jgi:hypothetical protein
MFLHFYLLSKEKNTISFGKMLLLCLNQNRSNSLDYRDGRSLPVSSKCRKELKEFLAANNDLQFIEPIDSFLETLPQLHSQHVYIGVVSGDSILHRISQHSLKHGPVKLLSFNSIYEGFLAEGLSIVYLNSISARIQGVIN